MYGLPHQCRCTIRQAADLKQIDEDIVLDVQNYTRQAGNELMLGKAEPMSDVKACYCSLCCDQETKYWTSAIEDFDSDINSWQNTINDLLLPPRLLGFALNRKEWCQFSLNCITPVPQLEPSVDGAQKNGLVFPDSVEEDERNDIYSLVRNHWKIMARPPEQRIADIIGGKGESLILLFHGKLLARTAVELAHVEQKCEPLSVNN